MAVEEALSRQNPNVIAVSHLSQTKFAEILQAIQTNTLNVSTLFLYNSECFYHLSHLLSS